MLGASPTMEANVEVCERTRSFKSPDAGEPVGAKVDRQGAEVFNVCKAIQVLELSGCMIGWAQTSAG